MTAQSNGMPETLLSDKVLESFRLFDERGDGTIETSCIKGLICKLCSFVPQEADDVLRASGAFTSERQWIDYHRLLTFLDSGSTAEPIKPIHHRSQVEQSYFETVMTPFLRDLTDWLLENRPTDILEGVQTFCSEKSNRSRSSDTTLDPPKLPLRRALSIQAVLTSPSRANRLASRRGTLSLYALGASFNKLGLDMSDEVTSPSGGNLEMPCDSGTSTGRQSPSTIMTRQNSNIQLDTRWVVRCSEQDLHVAEMISSSLSVRDLRVRARASPERGSCEDWTIWLLTPAWNEQMMFAAERNFNPEQDVIVIPLGMRQSEWLSKETAKGDKGPIVAMGMSYQTMTVAGAESFELLTSRFMAEVWTKLVHLLGVTAHHTSTELSMAIQGCVDCGEKLVPHVVGFMGSTTFFTKWTCKLLRYFAEELASLDDRHDGKALVICTGGFRNMNDPEDMDNQGVGHTVGEAYHELGHSVIHILPELDQEQRFSSSAEHLLDGTFLPVEFGKTLFAGHSNAERLDLMADVCDTVFLVEGGPMAAKGAKDVLDNTRVTLVPVRATGGAASGKMFNLPKIDRPLHVDATSWAIVAESEEQKEMSDATLKSMAKAMAKITEECMFPLNSVEASPDRSRIQSRASMVAHGNACIEIPAWELSETEFTPPKIVASQPQMRPILRLLSLYEKSLRRYGRWHLLEEPHLLKILHCIRGYLIEYIERSRNERQIQLMKEAYTMHGCKFLRVFSTILQDVIMPEAAFQEFVDTVSIYKEQSNIVEPEQQLEFGTFGLASLLPLYRSAFAARSRLHSLGARLAEESGAILKKAPLKKMWRCLEKMVEKHRGSDEDDRSAASIKDITRIAIEGDMEQLLRVFRLMVATEEIRIARVKNRFKDPGTTGWADCQLMIIFNEDESQHICEIQLVHPQLMLVRSNMGAHHQYGLIRSAVAMLEIYGEPLPAVTNSL